MKQIVRCLIFTFFCAVTATAQQLVPNPDGGYATEPQQYTLPANAIKTIRIMADPTLFGEISVIAVNEQKYSLLLTKEAHKNERSTASRYVDHITTAFTPKQDTVVLNIHAPSPTPWGDDTDAVKVIVELTVPKNCSVVIDAPRLSLSAEGPLTSVINTTSESDIEIFNVDGIVDIRSSGHDISIEQISGTVVVANREGKLEARNIVSRGKPAQFRNEGGNTVLDNITGAIAVKNSEGKVEITEFNPSSTERSFVTNSQGPILLELKNIPSGDIAVSNRDDDIELRVPKEISALLSLSVDEASRIEVSNLNLEPELVLPNRLSLRIGSGKIQINGSARGNGNIFVRGMEGDN